MHAVADLSEVPRLAREDGYVGRREDAVAHVAALAQPAAFVAVVVAGAAVVAGVVVVLLLFAVAEGAEGDVRAGEEDAPVVVAIHGVRSRGAGVRADGVVPVVSACFADQMVLWVWGDRLVGVGGSQTRMGVELAGSDADCALRRVGA